jgi:peptidoglycan/LPS O-acetylase OafA/YrhL
MSTSATAVIERESTQAQAESFYRPGLDVLRALAFLMVFIAHGLAWHLNKPTQIGAMARAGEFGVCIFFFLSSYLITELLLREKRDTGTILIPAFYVRRILRIWPLYFAMIAASCLYGLFAPAHAVSIAWTISLLLLFTNWYTAGHGYPPGFLFPLWSISLEEQFYLLWPAG